MMRGILLLACGAAMIWWGLTVDGPRAAERAPGPSDGSALESDPELPPGERGPSEQVPAESEASSQGESNTGAGRGDDPSGAPTVVEAPPQPDTAASAPLQAEPDAYASEGSPGDSGAATLPVALAPRSRVHVEVANLLLESWVEETPGRLEAFLNDPESALDDPSRRLLVAFWQSMAGAHDEAASVADALQEHAQAGRSDVTGVQLELLRAAGNPAPDRPIPATLGVRDPIARAMRMVELEERARRSLERQQFGLAASSASDLIQLELDAPWPPHRAVLLDWAALLNQAQAQHRLNPKGEWASIPYLIVAGDTLEGIRHKVLKVHPELLLCTGLIAQCNRVEKYIHPGQTLRIPTERPNVLVDLDARLCVYRHGTEAVKAWEVGIGREGHETPVGAFTVGEKEFEPSWMPAGRPALPFGHAENPLGSRWIAWHLDGAKTSFGFHGTQDPGGVGERVSQGCVRMHNAEVEVLFEILPRGGLVHVQP